MNAKKEAVALTSENYKKVGVKEFISMVAQSKLRVYESKEQFEGALKSYNDIVIVLSNIVQKNEEEFIRLNEKIASLEKKD